MQILLKKVTKRFNTNSYDMDLSLKIATVCSANVLSIQQNMHQRFSEVVQKLWIKVKL